MMPWRPPIMFVSIVGQASFQTAGGSGPSTMERSYRRRSGAAEGLAAAGAAGGAIAPAGGSAAGWVTPQFSVELELGIEVR